MNAIKASKTSGTAPLSVFFETEVGDFHDDYFLWEFEKSARYNTGANSAHVFNKPGTYEVSLTHIDCDNNKTVHKTKIIVKEFIGDTFYVAANGDDKNDGKTLGKPLKTLETACKKVKDILVIGPTAIRVLFKRGDSFSTRGYRFGSNIVGNPCIFGAYGDLNQPKPIITNYIGNDDYTFGFLDGCKNFTFMDLDLRGMYQFLSRTGPHYESTLVVPLLECENFLLYRVDARNSGALFSAGGGDPRKHKHHCIIDCHIQDMGSVPVFIAGERVAVVGNKIERSDSTHILRVWQATGGIIAHNDLYDASYQSESGRHALKLHAQEAPTTRVVVTGNRLRGSTWVMTISPQDYWADEALSDIVVEKNVIYSDKNTTVGVRIIANRVTLRNNIIIGQNSKRGMDAFVIGDHEEQVSHRVNILHNEFVNTNQSAGAFLRIEEGYLPITCVGNIMQCPQYSSANNGWAAPIIYQDMQMISRLISDHNIWCMKDDVAAVGLDNAKQITPSEWQNNFHKDKNSFYEDALLQDVDHGNYISETHRCHIQEFVIDDFYGRIREEEKLPGPIDYFYNSEFDIDVKKNRIIITGISNTSYYCLLSFEYLGPSTLLSPTHHTYLPLPHTPLVDLTQRVYSCPYYKNLSGTINEYGDAEITFDLPKMPGVKIPVYFYIVVVTKDGLVQGNVGYILLEGSVNV